MMENDVTLEQLNSEYQVLKAMLSKQEIVNDRLLRSTMRNQVRDIRKTVSLNVICAVIVMLMAPSFHYNPVINASWYFVAGTEILMAFCAFMDWKFNHVVQNTDLSSCDLLSLSKNVQKLKSDYLGWEKWGIILGFLWAVWLMIEVWRHSTNSALAISFSVGVALGLVAGMIVGYRMDQKIVRICDEIISQIEQ